MPVQIRPFVRGDRDQLAALVNAHVAAVVPNVSVSVQALMSQLERVPGEFIVDPWVTARSTLVAVQRDRLVAAAHLLRLRGRRGRRRDLPRLRRDPVVGVVATSPVLAGLGRGR
ncbi:MAG: hypothetical protein WKH47_08255 [Actinomycetes bacterium]